MSRNTSGRNNQNYQSRRPSHNEKRDRGNNNNFNSKQKSASKKKEKDLSLIIIKSSVVALSIVLIIMLVSVVLKINNNKKTTNIKTSCSQVNKNLENIDENNHIRLLSQVSIVKTLGKNKIVIVTEKLGSKQELLILNKCGDIISRKVIEVGPIL